MVSVFSYTVKAKCILIIRVQCSIVALIETRKSLIQSGPQSNPAIVLISIKREGNSRT
jgi:hypothetical protein